MYVRPEVDPAFLIVLSESAAPSAAARRATSIRFRHAQLSRWHDQGTATVTPTDSNGRALHVDRSARFHAVGYAAGYHYSTNRCIPPLGPGFVQITPQRPSNALKNI